MIPAFLDKLDIVLETDDVGDGRATWRLDKRLRYYSGILHNGSPVGLIEVPAGFTTDLASVPRIAGAWLIAGGIANAAAVVHDYLYETRALPRKVADSVFAEAMASEGVGFWRRGLMWAAVRLFGGPVWRAD